MLFFMNIITTKKIYSQNSLIYLSYLYFSVKSHIKNITIYLI